MSDRNRAEGWQHAKLSGHKNERLIAELTRSNPALQKESWIAHILIMLLYKKSNMEDFVKLISIVSSREQKQNPRRICGYYCQMATALIYQSKKMRAVKCSLSE